MQTIETKKTLFSLPWHTTAITMLRVHRLVLLVGRPGGGKSSFAEYAALKQTGVKPKVLQGNKTAQKSDLWGHFEIGSHGTKFIDGPLPEALKTGAWLIVEDFSLIPLEVRSLLLALRGQSEISNPSTKERIAIPDSFRMIATSNPESLKCRDSTMLAQALLDDFLILEVPNQVVHGIKSFLLHHFPKAPQETTQFVLSKWSEFEQIASDAKSDDENTRLSYRAADHLMKLLLAGMDRDEAVTIALANKYILDQDAHSTAKLKISLQDEIETENDQKPIATELPDADQES